MCRRAHSNCVDLLKGCVDDRPTSSEAEEEDRAVVGSVTITCVSGCGVMCGCCLRAVLSCAGGLDNSEEFWGNESNVVASGDALSCVGELVNDAFWGEWSNGGAFCDDSCREAWAREFVPVSDGVVGEV